MALRSYALRTVMAAALIGGALILWLSTGAATYADTASQSQMGSVTVSGGSIRWGTAGTCTQDMRDFSFGSVLPGTGPHQSPLFTGCVTSDTEPWNVTAFGPDFVGDADFAHIIDRAHEGITVRSLSGGQTSCPPPDGCQPIGPGVLIHSGPVGTTEFTYDYDLSVPNSTVPDTYRNTVRFTASN